jgi:GNAT superfamily N-acetyltransferase
MPVIVQGGWCASCSSYNPAVFADAALAARIDRAEARMCAEIARFVGAQRPEARSTVMPISGGVASFVSPSSPINKVIGLALDASLDLEALEQIESTWRERDEPVRVELSVLADPSAGGLLTDRGYRLHGFEHVFGLALDGVALEDVPAEISIDVARDDELQAWLDIAVEAFMNLDGTGSVADDALPRQALANAINEAMGTPGFVRYLARIDGAPVGEAAMRIDGDLAQIAGAGTLPHARGRGVQKALVRRRLADARAAGCAFAVVTTAPGTRSQQNVMRRGFELLYARAILVRSPA